MIIDFINIRDFKITVKIITETNMAKMSLFVVIKINATITTIKYY